MNPRLYRYVQNVIGILSKCSQVVCVLPSVIKIKLSTRAGYCLKMIDTGSDKVPVFL